jgi:hypothetical protein
MIAVQVYASLNELRARHGEALSYAAQGKLFHAIEWFDCLVAHGLFESLTPRIYAAADGEMPAEAAFLFCARDGAGNLVSLTNFYTMEWSAVFAPGASRRAALVEAIVAHIASERPRWPYVNFRLLHEADPVGALIETSLGRNGFATHRYFQLLNIHEPVEGLDFARYFEKRPSRMKNTVRRREKKLRAEHEVKIACLDRLADGFLSDYEAIYANSWQRTEAAPRLVAELCRTADTLGLLRVGMLHVDGTPAAAQIWLMSGARAILYKLAYDEMFADFSVGTILTRAMTEFVLGRDKVSELDFGVGGDAYKKDWMEQERRLTGIEAFNRRTPKGNVLALRQWAGGLVRRYSPAEKPE